MAFKLYIVVLLVFSLANLAFFIFKPLRYHVSLRTLRKTLYTLFIGAISLGLLLDEIRLADWELILTLTAIVVFMDIALLLTPSIMKIWSAEFHYTDYVEEIIKANDKIHKAMVYRVEAMSEMIQTNSELLPFRNYTDQELRNYLDLYAEKFGFDIQIHRIPFIEFSADDADPSVIEGLAAEEIEMLGESYRLNEGIRMTVEQIKTINNFDFDSEEEDVEILAQSAVVPLIEDESMLVPVFMETDQFIVVLKEDIGEVLEVDAIHITNLIYLFYSL
ncbi:type II toxin-antitoxin system SpoIISA family toxin [[Bacillus] enclensis]|uniref:type II toxin-antitoxin system SpoIISA family toxin n=1 Tax=[Bacillus] enclensis TaxID=1402860 RepID=UPI0018DEBE55|nr:type II toxin-antitoxin system SpoIISA family toxin [[Bacillus] enclensis]MBH9966183.1 type II toxin-antitoxin system SpoIISA family toxin [[Bacillus] enclensis]